MVGSGHGLAPNSIEYVLAASWQPAFCATSAGQGKAECVSQTADRFDATHFSIHGLWPDDLDDRHIFPCYCDRGAPVACGGSQARDASIDLPADVLADLTIACRASSPGCICTNGRSTAPATRTTRPAPMPAPTRRNILPRRWRLLEQLNELAVQVLFEQKLGEVARRAKRSRRRSTRPSATGQAIESSSGARGLKARMSSGAVDRPEGQHRVRPDLADLIRAAPETATSSGNRSCNSGRVVKVGAS